MNIQIFSGFSLKLLMTFLMVIDHIGYFFPTAPGYFRWLGRLVAPVFFFWQRKVMTTLGIEIVILRGFI